MSCFTVFSRVGVKNLRLDDDDVDDVGGGDDEEPALSLPSFISSFLASLAAGSSV